MHGLSPGVFLALALGAVGGCHRSAPRAFVTNEDSGDVTVIDTESDDVVGVVSLGKRPRGVRVSHDGKLLYVAVSGPPLANPAPARSAVHGNTPIISESSSYPASAIDGIAVVDLARLRVVRTLEAGHGPETFDMTPDDRTLYVSNDETSQVSTVDAAAGSVTRATKVGAEPAGVALSPDSNCVYVASESGSELDILNSSGALVGRIPTSMRPRGVAFTPDGREALVSAERDGLVQIVDTKTQTVVGTIATGTDAKPMGIVISPDGRHAYVTNGHEGSVSFIDIASRRVERVVAAVGDRPWGIGITPDGKKLYVAAAPDVAVIDVASARVLKRIAGGAGPWGIAIGRE